MRTVSPAARIVRPIAGRIRLSTAAVIACLFAIAALAQGGATRARGEESWVRVAFEIIDAATGAPLKGARIFYLSDQTADWFHWDNTQPLLPPGTYRIVAWEREYRQAEETFVVDPRNGLRQQKTMAIQPVSPKDGKGRRTVPAPLTSLIVVGNAGPKAPHSNYSHFVHSNIGDIKVYWDAWSEYPGEPGKGSRISSANARFEFTHDAEAARKRFEFFRPYFKLNPSKGDRFTGPVSAGLGDDSVLYRVERPRGDGGPGWLNQIQKVLILTGNVVIDLQINQQLGSPSLTTAEEMVRRVKALDMAAVKRIMEPEPFPWPKIVPRANAAPGGVAGPVAPPLSVSPPADQPPDDLADALPELTPAEIAAVAGVAGGTALLGSLLLLGASGVRREEVIEQLRELLRGRLPPDPFEAWKAKYEALGWRYTEAKGVATFVPVDGARNAAGEVFSAATGCFEPAAGSAPPPVVTPREGAINARGEVWSDADNAFVPRAYWEQERARRADLEARRAAEIAQAEQLSRAEADAVAADNARRAQAIADSRAGREAAHAADQALRDRLADKLRTGGADPADIERLSAAGDTIGLRWLYADHLHRVMDAASAEAAAQANWADVMAAGEYASKATLAAAKTGLMVIGGPAGTLAVAGGLGAITSVEEGARTLVAGGSAKEIAGAFATGFLSGAKDGAIGRYVNMPGVSAATKVALPAAADAAEAYARTGDLRTALTTGALSAVGGAAGQGLGTLGNTVARDGAQMALGGAMGAAGRAATDGNVAEGFLDGLAGSVGSSVGSHAANAAVARADPLPVPGAADERLVHTDPKLTAADIQLDADAAVRKTQAQGLVEDLKRAVASGTPEEQKTALTRVLENRDAKLLMKGADVDDVTKTAFADLADQHRTKPVFAATADHLNRESGPDGTPRFVVREPDPANPGGFLERKVLPSDFRSTSGTAGKAPGMDLDMTATATIVDRTTGRPARPADLDAAVGGACNTLGISKSGQEINLMHRESLERYTLRPGENPATFIPRAASGEVSGAEGRSLAEVTGAKLAEADVLHTGAGAVSEKCRIAAKDFDRITRPLIEATPGARVPPVFTVRDAATGETPLDILRAVADNRMPPGTGNARFRALTGMSLSEGADKLAQLPEFVAKAGTVGQSGAAPAGLGTTLSAGEAGREAARAALRQALRLGSN